MGEDSAGQGVGRSCQNCGAELQEGANFCPNCGASQGDGDAENVPPVPPEPGRIETPTLATAPRQESWFGRGFGGGFGAAIGWILGGCLVLAVLGALLFVGCAALVAVGDAENEESAPTKNGEPDSKTFSPVEFKGTGDDVSEPIAMPKGQRVFAIEETGGGQCFRAELLDEQAKSVGGSLASDCGVATQGSYEGSKTVAVPKDGDYRIQVGSQGGAWQVRVE